MLLPVTTLSRPMNSRQSKDEHYSSTPNVEIPCTEPLA